MRQVRATSNRVSLGPADAHLDLPVESRGGSLDIGAQREPGRPHARLECLLEALRREPVRESDVRLAEPLAADARARAVMALATPCSSWSREFSSIGAPLVVTRLEPSPGPRGRYAGLAFKKRSLDEPIGKAGDSQTRDAHTHETFARNGTPRHPHLRHPPSHQVQTDPNDRQMN